MGRMILVPGANYSGNNLGKATPSVEIPIEAMVIQGPSQVFGTADYTVKLYPTFTSERNVAWSIVSGGSYATINSSGRVIASTGAASSPVTIRCTSVDDPTIYAEKSIVCSESAPVYYDWIKGDGTGYIIIDRFAQLVGAKVTTIFTTGNLPNTYMFSSRAQENMNSADCYCLYLRSGGTTSRLNGGTRGSLDITGTNAQSIRYRAILQLSTAIGTNNATFNCYNDETDVLIKSYDSFGCYFNAPISVCAIGDPTHSTYALPANGKFYGCVIENGGEIIANFRPCLVGSIPCIHDTVSGNVYQNQISSSFTVGND